MPLKWRFVLGAGAIALAIGYLITTAVRNTSEHYLTVNEVGARQAQLSGQMLRVGGRVKAGTIGWGPATLTLGFAMVYAGLEGKLDYYKRSRLFGGILPNQDFQRELDRDAGERNHKGRSGHPRPDR